MTSIEPQLRPPPPSPPFQFSLRTLLLLFVVLGSSLGVFGAWGIVVFALVVGLAIYIREAKSLRPLMNSALIALCFASLVFLCWPSIESRELSPRGQCFFNLYQIAEALQRYRQANGSFPPAYTADNDGKLMHSWRALILPYLDEGAFDKTYDFTEPWNGPKNRDALRPFPYNCPCDHDTGGAETSYVAVVGGNAAWPAEKLGNRGPADLPRDPSRTIMLVEVTNSGILWSEPRDLSLALLAAEAESDNPLVSSNHRPPNNFFVSYPPHCEARVVMADGSVHCLLLEGLSTENLRKMLQVGACPQGAFATYDFAYQVRHLNWPNIAALAVWLLSVGTLLSCAVRSRKPRAAVRSETA